jgi:hypothetical protein
MANLAQVATGVDDQQVRDELAGTKQFIKGAADFVVNGDYAQAAQNVHQAAVSETVSALEGNVSATANVTQGFLALATLRSATKSKPKITAENQSGPSSVASQARVLDNGAASTRARVEANIAKSRAGNNSGFRDSGVGNVKPTSAANVAQNLTPKPISPTYRELKGINKGFQAHHIMPQYLGKMLGYTIENMLDHPATAVTQWTHTGKLNADAMHKAISRYLPPMAGGKKTNYTADQIRSGLQKAYSDIDRPELFDSVSHLIK